MVLDPEWKTILKKAYSAWMLYLMIFLSAIEAGLPYVIEGFALPAGTSAVLTIAISALTLWVRILYQPEVP
jgi:hypothetical protein